MKIIKATIVAILIAGAIVAAGAFGLSLYEQYESDKEYKLSQVQVLSKELNTRRKFIDLVLGSDIRDYKDFKLLDNISGSEYYDSESGEQAWGYFGKDDKYNMIGKFSILDPILDARLHDVNISTKDAENTVRRNIFVYTVNKKIYKIKATIMEYGESFNIVLKETYGPSVNDNGYNKVNYLIDNMIVWESKDVHLTSSLEIKSNYIKDKSGVKRLSMIMDKYRHLEYIYKPLQQKLDNQVDNKNNREIRTATEKL